MGSESSRWKVLWNSLAPSPPLKKSVSNHPERPMLVLTAMGSERVSGGCQWDSLAKLCPL